MTKKTSQTFPLTCSQCGKSHDEWPAIAYDAPVYYDELTDQEKTEIANLDGDFCEIQWETHTDRFIRVNLIIPVNEVDAGLEYGLWVSVSEKSFKNYKTNYTKKNHSKGYFGWLSNNIEGYETTEHIPVDVHTQAGFVRPMIEPQSDHKHPLVEDFLQGISKVEAEKRIHAVKDF